MAPSLKHGTSPYPVLEPFVVDRLNEIARQDGLTEGFTIETSSASRDELGSVVRVVLKGPRNGKPASKSLIVKCPPKTSDTDCTNSVALFTAEVRVYEQLLKTFVQFQRDKKIAIADGFYNIPKIYSIICDDERKHFAIIMEDLAEQTYSSLNNFVPVDMAHARLVARELGRFHGVSFALFDQRPDVFEALARHENIILSQIEKKPLVLEIHQQAFKRAIETLDAADTELRAKFEAAIQNFVPLMRKCLHSRLDEPMRVIGHGDFWNKNIMFKHIDGRPNAVCLIDYQTSALMSPVLDIFSYLFLSADKCFRDRHAEDMLREYHTSLSQMVKKLGSDPDRLFSWGQFEREMLKFGIYNVLMAPFMLQVTTANANDVRHSYKAISDGYLDSNISWSESTRLLYNERVRDVLRHADEYGLFTAN